MRNSLRMRPDRIIVGEVRGGETLDMLQALNTGHEGSLVTVHANSCDDAVHRLETLATMSDLQIPFEALRDQINSAIHVIVQIDRYADGRRRVAEVAAVASQRREQFRLATLARFEAEPLQADRRVVGTTRHFPLPPGIAALDRAVRRARPRRVRRRDRAGPDPRGRLMNKDGQALLLLIGVLFVALAGIATYLSGAARRAELAVARRRPAPTRRPWGGRGARSTAGSAARAGASASGSGSRARARRSPPRTSCSG